MSSHVQFETPENVEVSYRLAGLGTRFIAWFVDSILIWLLTIVSLFVLLVSGAAGETVVRGLSGGTGDVSEGAEAMLYAVGLFLLIFGLGSFAYFGLFELLMRGQTPGKRALGIRVVKADGFSLDPAGIAVRNIFRVVDQLPPLWIVPVVSSRAQRFGDMVASTVVVVDQPEAVTDLRETLLARPAAEGRFRFDASQLKRLRPVDAQAIERLLERWSQLPPVTRWDLVSQIVEPLAKRLAVDIPQDEADRLRFLEDLLAAEYRRQYRKLN